MPRFKLFVVNVMGVEAAGTDEEIALKDVEALEGFFGRIHMPTNLRKVGVSATEEVLATMARKCAISVNSSAGSAI